MSKLKTNTQYSTSNVQPGHAPQDVETHRLPNAEELAAPMPFLRYSAVLLFDILRFGSVTRLVSRCAQPAIAPCSSAHITRLSMNKARFAQMGEKNAPTLTGPGQALVRGLLEASLRLPSCANRKLGYNTAADK
jgi:hypothetical protein